MWCKWAHRLPFLFIGLTLDQVVILHPAQASKEWPPALIGSPEPIVWIKKIVGAKHRAFHECVGPGGKAIDPEKHLALEIIPKVLGLPNHRQDNRKIAIRWSDPVGNKCLCHHYATQGLHATANVATQDVSLDCIRITQDNRLTIADL